MSNSHQPAPTGRGSHSNPPNRFEKTHAERDLEHCEHDAELLAQLDRPPTEYLADQSQSVVTENDSPDISFRYSLNPYRGCAHGCSYCYARPTHEYLGLERWAGFRDESVRQARRAGASAHVSGSAELASGNDCDVGRHRLLSTGGAAVPPHARLLGGGARGPAADRDHHEERPGAARS